MKKLSLYLLIIFFSSHGFSQDIKTINIKTPNGLLDKIFDNYGNAMQLHDIEVSPKISSINGQTLNTNLIVTAGIFELYFEQGSGFEATNTIETERRNIAIAVFSEMSNFLLSTLKNNNQKIRIWFRTINEIANTNNQTVSFGTSYYNVPKNTNSTANIAYNQIWKTINSGKDAYSNIANLLNENNELVLFYHATFAFQFNQPQIKWNTKIEETPKKNEYDLYTILLQEFSKSLGINSFIAANGISKLPSDYKFYTYYDTFLKNQNDVNLISSPQGINAQENFSFTASSTNLQQSCGGSAIQNANSTCTTSINFAGSNTVTLYTPNCFSNLNSFNYTNGNCNPNSLLRHTIDKGIMQRYLSVQDRQLLHDLGYNFNTTFGNLANSSFQDYVTVLEQNQVVGVNDGLEIDNTYYSATNELVNISNLLTNDLGDNLVFENLKDITYSNTMISNISGNAETIINLTSNIPGYHLLSYIPYNSATGKRGNITYVYLYLLAVCADNNPDICSFVANGDFEDNFEDFFTQLPIEPLSPGDIYPACSWSNFGSSSADYFYENTGSDLNIPNNFFGNETDLISGNKAYAGIYATRGGGNEVIVNRLNNNLQQSINYTLTFTVSKADNVVNNSDLRFQAYITNTSPITFGSSINASTGNYSVSPTNGILLTSPVFSNTTNGWETITLNFNSGNILNLRNLYIGKINETATPLLMPNTAQSQSYFYIDNVRLIETPPVTPVLSLPSPLCTTDAVLDLNTYLTNGVTGGFFSIDGTPITGSTFNPTTVGVGTHTITYTIPNPIACPEIVVSGTILVNSCAPAQPPYISQVYYNNTDKFIEVKNSSDTQSINAGNYYLVVYPNGADTSLPPLPVNTINLGTIPAQDVKVWKAATGTDLGYVTATDWAALDTYTGNGDILILTTSTDASAYNNRIDEFGATSFNAFNDNITLLQQASFVRMSCAPAIPTPVYNQEHWVYFTDTEVANTLPYNLTNGLLGRHYGDVLTFQPDASNVPFGYWDEDLIPVGTIIGNESNPDRSRVLVFQYNYNTSDYTSFEACSVQLNNLRTLTITASNYAKVFTSIDVTAAGSSLIVENQGSLVMVYDTFNGISDTNLINLGASATMQADKQTVGVNGPYDYVYWSSPLSAAPTNPTISQIFPFGFGNNQFNPTRFYIFENINFYDQLATYGINGGGTDGYDDNFDDYNPFNTATEQASSFIPGRGYNTWPPIGDTNGYSVSFTGQMNNGKVTVPVYRNNSINGGNYNLVGNPYPSAIDLDILFSENSNLIEPFAAIWGRSIINEDNPNNTNTGPNQLNYREDNYQIYNPIMSIDPVFDNNTRFNSDGILASCQSFFVRTKDPVSGYAVVNTGLIEPAGDLVFKNKMRTILPNTTFARMSSTNRNTSQATYQEQGDKLWVNLTDTSGYTAQLGVAFLSNANLNFVQGEDIKTINGRKYNFYTQSTTEDLIIDVQSSFSDDKIIPLGITNTSDISQMMFTISIPKKAGIFNSQTVYLYDALLNSYHNLSNTSYTFTSNAEIIENRFSLRFTLNNSTLAKQSVDNQVVVFANSDTLIVKSVHQKIQNIEVLDIYTANSSGVLVAKKGNVNALETQLPVSGSYKLLNVKIQLQDGSIINTKIIK